METLFLRTITMFTIIKIHKIMGCSQAVRQRVLIPSCAGSNPATPANLKNYDQ
jgi:hypothetical protein